MAKMAFSLPCFYNQWGMTTETKQFHRRLSQLLFEKSDVSYSDTSAWVKQQISFRGVSQTLFDDVIHHFPNPFEFPN